ncbi:MAG: ParB/RepB/Spo0J family partition protein [Ruminococcaceae bacterium]|nr:ParB/RepB/Spo0J family partition protein [Oscillospiraceae bacterium]
MAKKRALGKGLDNLFSNNDVSDSGGITNLPIYDVEPKADQPRKNFDPDALNALADSIAKNGVLQPILVRETLGGMYQIIAGERRWRASKLAGLSEIPAIIMETDELRCAEIALIENIQREDLNPYEEAEAYSMLIQSFDLTQEEVSEKVGRSRSAVANSLRLLELPEEISTYLKDGTLSAGHCRALLGLKTRADIAPLAKTVIEKSLSVRETEAAVKAKNKAPKEKQEKIEGLTVNYVAELEKKVTDLSGRYCKIATKGKRKTITVEYSGDGDLEALLSAICGAKITEE